MLITELDTYCMEHLVSFLDKPDVLEFSKVGLDQEATDAYWRKTTVIRFSECMTVDDKLLQYLRLCPSLKELVISCSMSVPMTHSLLNTIGLHSRALETLDISGINLTSYKTSFLSSCPQLKSLSVRIPFFYLKKPSRGLFHPETQLEHLSVDGYIKRWRRWIRQANNETRSLFFLSDVAATQRSLKSLTIETIDEDIVGEIFANNPHLEVVTVTGNELRDMRCLLQLPKTLKHLRVRYCGEIATTTLIEFFRGWHLDSFTMDAVLIVACPNIMAELPPLRHLEIKRSVNSFWPSLGSLRNLSHLRSLSLTEFEYTHNARLTEIFRSCVNVASLDIDGRGMRFSPDLFKIIAEMPKLKDIRIGHDRRDTDYMALMRWLSTSKTLTSVNLRWFQGLETKDILMLIQGSSILENLELSGNTLEPDLVLKIIEVLTQQKNRTNILDVTFHEVEFHKEDIPKGSCHSLLRVQFK